MSKDIDQHFEKEIDMPKITFEEMTVKEKEYIIKYFEMSGFEKKDNAWYFNPKFIFKKIERLKTKDFLDVVQNKKITKEFVINDEDVFMNKDDDNGWPDLVAYEKHSKFANKCFDMIRKMYPNPLFHWTNKTGTASGMAVKLKDLIELYNKIGSFDIDFKNEMSKYLNGKKSKQKESIDEILKRIHQSI